MSSEVHDQRSEGLRIIDKKYIGRWISALIVLLILLAMEDSTFSNPRFEWSVVTEDLTDPSIVQGIPMTLQLIAISAIFGFADGTILALMCLSSNPVLAAVSWGYTWLFREVPVLAQLLLWYNIAAFYSTTSISPPQVGEIWNASVNSLISSLSATMIALVMHQSAYTVEVIRVGIQSIGTRRVEVARVLGYHSTRILLHTVLSQTVRAILPPAGSEVIGQLRTAAAVSVILLRGILFSARIAYQRVYEVIPLLLVTTSWYPLLTSLLSMIQYYVERHLSRSSHRRVKCKVGKASASDAASTPSISAGETSRGRSH